MSHVTCCLLLRRESCLLLEAKQLPVGLGGNHLAEVWQGPPGESWNITLLTAGFFKYGHMLLDAELHFMK
jgi:hypothetical protein